MPLSAPDSFVIADRFETERLAGSGGMGSVYRARDRVIGGPVAIKLLNPAPKHEWRFEREAELLAQLSHPGIVRHIAHGRLDDGRLYLALEWLEGEDLEARLAGRGLTMREALILARRVAEALGAAHSLGIVHRDVKPSNVFLIDGDPTRSKLLDFGVARVLSASATRTGTALGTPAYMAPEQAKGERDLDARADVWSLGCVLFECLCGSPPFTGNHPMAILGKIVIARAPHVTELRPEVPPDLDDLVARMLSREREARPVSGNAAAVELAELGELGVPDRTTRSARMQSIGATGEVLGDVLLLESAARDWQADPEGALAAAKAAGAAFPAPSPGAVRARLEAAIHESRIGKLDRLVEVIEGVAEDPSALADTRITSALALAIPQLLRAGRRDLAEAVATRMEQAVGDLAADPMAAHAVHLARAWVALFAGDLAASLAHDEAGAAAAERAGNLRVACRQRADAGYERLLLGDAEGALGACQSSLAQSERMGLESVALQCLHNGGLALLRLGRLDEALDYEQRAVQGYAKVKDWRLQGASHAYLSLIHLARGDQDVAEVEARMGAGLMAETPSTHAFGLACLARVLLARGKLDEALATAAEAHAELEAAGQVEDGAHLIRLTFAEALHAAGRLAEAREAIARARDQVDETAAKIHDPTHRRSFVERVPENARTLELAQRWLAAG